MSVVRMIVPTLAPVEIKPAAINWEEPANTNKDIPIVPAIDKPALTASAPKMMPKGMAPMTKGKVALTPFQNSDLGVE